MTVREKERKQEAVALVLINCDKLRGHPLMERHRYMERASAMEVHRAQTGTGRERKGGCSEAFGKRYFVSSPSFPTLKYV